MKIGENAKRGLGERRRAYKGRERDWPGRGYCRSRDGAAGTGEALAAVGGRNGAPTGSRRAGGKMSAKKHRVYTRCRGIWNIESREPEAGGGKQPKGERAEISGGADRKKRERDRRR